MVDRMWDPKNTPHHSIVGLTGSGKSYLAVNGILDMCSYDRVLLVDSKGDDEVLTTAGTRIRDIPSNPWHGLGRRREPRQWWYRLVLYEEEPRKARIQIARALDRVYREGNWVLYFDELHHLTGTRAPNLNLGPQIERIYRLGRNRRISIVAGTQTPVLVPRVFYDQASFAWIGRIRDRERQKRLLDVGGLDRRELPVLETLQRRQWLLAADNGDVFARTMVT